MRICLYSVRIQENTDQKKLRIWTLFTQCFIFSTDYLHFKWKKKGINRVFKLPEAVAQSCSVNKLFLNISQNSQENTSICRARLATLFKKNIWHRCFLANFAKISITPVIIEHFRWLFLDCPKQSKLIKWP